MQPPGAMPDSSAREERCAKLSFTAPRARLEPRQPLASFVLRLRFVTPQTYLSALASSGRSLYRDTRGTVTIEYVVVIGTMALGGALGLVAVGLALVESFAFVRGLLLSGVP
jgi:hypothetical protein